MKRNRTNDALMCVFCILVIALPVLYAYAAATVVP
jgi:hypothetical protein